jgi:hypothetical protein
LSYEYECSNIVLDSIPTPEERRERTQGLTFSLSLRIIPPSPFFHELFLVSSPAPWTRSNQSGRSGGMETADHGGEIEDRENNEKLQTTLWPDRQLL